MVKNAPAKARGESSIPGSGRSPAGGNGNLLQHSCLGNSMDRESWQAIESMGSQNSWSGISD